MPSASVSIKPVQINDSIFPLSVAQYHDMIRLGVLGDDDPVELLEGALIFDMPKKPRHRFVTRALFDVLSAALPSGWHCQMQEPLTLTDGEPEPDLAIVKGRPADYRDRHPGPQDVAIVIEVSDTTLERDRGAKLRSYARAGIRTYWIIDMADRAVHIFHQPNDDCNAPRYDLIDRFDFDQRLPVTLSGTPTGMISVSVNLD